MSRPNNPDYPGLQNLPPFEFVSRGRRSGDLPWSFSIDPVTNVERQVRVGGGEQYFFTYKDSEGHDARPGGGPCTYYSDGSVEWTDERGQPIGAYEPAFGCAAHLICDRASALKQLNRKKRIAPEYELYLADIDRLYPET